MGTTSDAVVLDSEALDQLNSVESKTLLDTIDSLRTLGVGEIVNLPQIIVVGDQSSGKSSVLEAISRVRFPVKGDLCTRFATELVLRKAPHSSIDVKINFAPSTSIFNPPKKAEPFRRTGFDPDDLPAIIEEAKESMGIRDGTAKGFSKDVLRVEITGPDVYSLTLVDLSGFFHSRTATQTLEDRDLVNQLAENYMKQKNSIILAVVGANHTHAGQTVLEELIKHDPLRERTLGVITKPDLCKPGSSEERSGLQLARNMEKLHQLNLGWHVLRNRSEDEGESSSDSRDATEERFFQTSAWSALPCTSLGIENLRKRLSNVLLSHIQHGLPQVIREIETALRGRQDSLEHLGKPRSRTEDLRSYLLDIAESFQRLTGDAVNGRYGDKFFGNIYDNEMKLRARLRNLNRAFHFTLLNKGATHEIQWTEDSDGESDDGESNDGDKKSNDDDEIPQYLQPYLDLYKFPDSCPIEEEALKSNVEMLASANQGREFPGSPTADLVLQLFKTQASPWQGIAQCHLTLATQFTKVFVEQLFSYAVGADKETVTSILRHLVDPFFEKKAAALESKLTEILRPYTCSYGLPLEMEFRQRLSKRSLHRLAGRVADLMEGVQSNGPRGDIKRKTVMRALLDEDEDGDQFGEEQVIDMMVVYYDISLRNFTENVINLAVEGCLVSDLPGILTPKKVDRMTEEELRDLASETEEVKAERALLQRETEILRTGLGKCQKHRPREMTVLPTTFTIQTPPKAGTRSIPTPQKPTEAPSKTPSILGSSPAPTPFKPKAPSILFTSPVKPTGGGLFSTLNPAGPFQAASQSTSSIFGQANNPPTWSFGQGT